jgi:2-oxoglutarate dehydrogenase E1 component
VTRLLLCSGKIYYDLVGAARRGELPQLAVGRIEGLYPFPATGLAALVGLYPSLEEVVWVQEEPRNMGALAYIGPRLRAGIPKEVGLRHVARPERASPAEGKNRNHRIQQERIVREALGIE